MNEADLRRKLWIQMGAVCVLGVITLAAIVLWPAPSDSDASGVNMTLPFKLNGMIGFDVDISEAERLILPDDTEFARKVYRSRLGDQLLVSIVLSGSDKRSIHRPEICLPGQGWTIKGGKKVDVPLANHRGLEVMNLFLERQIQNPDGTKMRINSYYMYWFVGSDMVTASHVDRILRSMWDRIFMRKNHRWAYVIVSATITEGIRPTGGLSAEETQEMMERAIAEIAPDILKPEVLKRLKTED